MPSWRGFKITFACLNICLLFVSWVLGTARFIWGRGALDVKFGVAGLLEAVTNLLQQGFQPRRTVMLSFGNDEEVGPGTGGHCKVELKGFHLLHEKRE